MRSVEYQFTGLDGNGNWYCETGTKSLHNMQTPISRSHDTPTVAFTSFPNATLHCRNSELEGGEATRSLRE